MTHLADDWQPIETAPKCDGGIVGSSNGRKPVMVTRCPYTGHHAPMAVARLTKKGWISGVRGNRLWFEPTHWMPLPPPPANRPPQGEEKP